MPKKKPNKKKKPAQRQRNAPLHIPLPFEQIVDAMLQTPPLKKKKAGSEKSPPAAEGQLRV
jgi:hypothetical protein